MRGNAEQKEGEMARETSTKRGAAIIAMVAAFAALAGPGVASAAPKPALPPPVAAPAAVAPAAAVQSSFGVIASWAEEASWAES
jgi:hypothetical protein